MRPDLGPIDRSQLGDMPVEEFRILANNFTDWVCSYFSNIESYPVLSSCKPGDIKKSLPDNVPVKGNNLNNALKEFDKIIVPGLTHWNHPNFNAYFSNTGSGPALLGDILSAAVNINAMLWKTSPSATELEERMIDWMKELLGVPEYFFGMIVDTASSATFTAIVAARENVEGLNIRVKGFYGNGNSNPLILYCSNQAHSSIDKGASAAGIGLENVKKIPSDENYSLIPDELERMIQHDIESGSIPFCVVSTIGTTSTTSIDPVKEIGEICSKYNIWHHVDAAYAGSATVLPEYKYLMEGFDKVDSYITNPHKWLFTPIDTSLVFFKDPEHVKEAFSLVPEYLRTAESSETTDYMNYGIQLGRRFRSLKLWFVLQYYGQDGLINRLRDHIRIARLFETFIVENPDFELLAPVPFSVICFRYNPGGSLKDENKLEELNSKLMEDINSTGKLYLSHTKLNEKYTIRFAIGNIRTNEEHIRKSWNLIKETAAKL